VTEISNNNLNSSDKRVLSESNQPNEPALSAIVVIPDSYDTLRTTMSYLHKQTVADQIEIVFVIPSVPKIEIDRSELSCFHSWQVVEIDSIPSIAGGFVTGIRQAHAPVIALTEDHAFPDANWAETFITAHKQHWAVVGPCMRNCNPDNILSWADFYQAYGEYSPPLSSGPVRHLPGHNSSYKRDILLEFGNRLEELMEAESVLHRHLKAKGYELLLEPKTCTSHLNFTSWSTWIPVKYYTGRQFAATWSITWSWPRRLLFTLASPLFPFIRFWYIQKEIRRTQSTLFLIRIAPSLLGGLLFEGLGHMVSYLPRKGDHRDKVMKYEFNRVNQIKPTKRQ
jgi:hypothetical protein